MNVKEQRESYNEIMKELYQEGYARRGNLEYTVNEIESHIEVYCKGKLLDTVRTPHEVWESVKELLS